MSDDVAEAMRLVSSLSKAEISSAMQIAFQRMLRETFWLRNMKYIMSANGLPTIHTSPYSPDSASAISLFSDTDLPPVSSGDLAYLASNLNSLEVRLQLMVMNLRLVPKNPNPRVQYWQEVKTYPDGTKAQIGILEKIEFELDPNAEKAWQRFEKVAEAAEKWGLPKTAISHATMSAGLTALFDVGRLYRGNYLQYFSNVGVSAFQSGSVAKLSSCITNKFLSHAGLLNFAVGTGIDTVGAAFTGHWERLLPNLGTRAIGGGGACAGAYAGGALGAVGGPIGVTIGSFVGSLVGGFVAQSARTLIPFVGGSIQHEVNQPEINQPEIHQPQIHQPEIHQPQIHQPEIHQPQIHQPQIHQPEIHQPQIHQLAPPGHLADLDYEERFTELVLMQLKTPDLFRGFLKSLREAKMRGMP